MPPVRAVVKGRVLRGKGIGEACAEPRDARGEAKGNKGSKPGARTKEGPEWMLSDLTAKVACLPHRLPAIALSYRMLDNSKIPRLTIIPPLPGLPSWPGLPGLPAHPHPDY